MANPPSRHTLTPLEKQVQGYRGMTEAEEARRPATARLTKEQRDELYAAINDGILEGPDADKAAELIFDFDEGGGVVSDTTPYNIKSKPVWGRAAVQSGGIIPPSQPQTPEELAAAQEGVDVESGIPGANYPTASFAIDDQQREAYFVRQLQQSFPNQELTLRGGVESGRPLEYFNQDTNRWTRVLPSTRESQIGQILPAAGEVAGAIGGAVVASPTANPAAMIALGGAGAMVGAGFGEAARINVGTALGANDPKSMDPMATERAAFATGGAALGTNLLFDTALIGVPRTARMMFRGKAPISDTEAVMLLNESKKYDQILADINARIPARQRIAEDTGLPMELNPSIAQRATLSEADRAAVRQDSGSSAVLGRQGSLTEDPRLAAREETRRKNNESIFELWWREAITKDVNPNASKLGAGREVKDALQRIHDDTAAPYERRAAAAVARAEQEAAQTQAPLSPAKAGLLVRDSILKEYDDSVAQKTEAWKNYEEKAGYKANFEGSSHQVPVNHDIINASATIDNLIENSLLRSERTSATGYAIDAKQPSRLLGPDGKPISKNSMDLQFVDHAIKMLNLEYYAAQAGETEFKLTDYPRGRLLNALKDARAAYFESLAAKGQPELGEALAKANAEQVRHVETFRRGMTSKLLTKDETGNYRLSNSEVVHKIIKNKDEEAAMELAGYVNGNPLAKKELLNFFLAHYRRNYMTGGVALSAGGHARFMQNDFPFISHFLDRGERASFSRLGGVAEAAEKYTKRLDEFEKSWAKTEFGKMGRMAPEMLINGFFTQSIKASDLGTVVASLTRNMGQGPVNAWRRGVINELNTKFRDHDLGYISDVKLSNDLRVNRTKYKILFGDQFVNDLDRSLSALRVMRIQPGGKIAPPPRVTATSDVLRVIEGPLTRGGRALTSLVNMRRRTWLNNLEEALYDKDALSRFATRVERDARNAKATLVGVAGISALGEFDD